MTRWKGLLALAVLASITGNVMHAVITAPTVYGWGAAISASLAPVFLFWHTHNLITAPSSARRGDWVGVLVISMIALGAFAVSFTVLRDLLITFGFAPTNAVILPIVVDVTIAGASWELVREERVGVSVHHQHTQQAVLADQQITEATDHLTQRLEPADQDSVIPAAQGAESGDFPVVGHLADQAENQFADHVDQALADQPTGAHQLVPDHPDREADQSADHVDQVADCHQVHAVDRDEAELIAESRGLSAGQIREVFSLLDAKVSQREAARRTGINQSQISRLAAERKKLRARDNTTEGAAA